MKKLVYEFTEAAAARRKVAEELVSLCNDLVMRFKAKHNFFGQTIDESFALQLLTSPIATFDELLRVNSPIKPVAGRPVDIKQLAALVSIDREGFIREFTIVRPGSRNQYQREGVREIMQLKEVDKDLLIWNNGSFTLDEKKLEQQIDRSFRIYAENEEQLKELQYWENLCAVLNAHIDRPAARGYEIHPGERKFLSPPDIYQMSKMLGLIDKNGRFEVDRRALADLIKNMVLVN